MPFYDARGNIVRDNYDYIRISDLKVSHSEYNDDELLEEAISLAKTHKSMILWDGEDIYFTGDVTHVCKGFKGINFNGSKIYMPNRDRGIILNIVPDESSDLEISAIDIGKSKTSNQNLINKVFSMNNNTSEEGNASMCLGDRANTSPTQVVYWTPTIKADTQGYYSTGELYLVPESGTVKCYNIHDYPICQFNLCNATIITYNSSNMSLFMRCLRSNTRIHNFRLEGVSGITTFHAGIFSFEKCCNIEVDHIDGNNPIQEANASGYLLQFSSVSFLHVHDVFLGDVNSWGAMGAHHLCNSVVERCCFHRWDCHYIQTGYHVVKDCILNRFLYGIGNGTINITGCIIKNNNTSNTNVEMIAARTDISAVYEGNIVVKDCVFESDVQSANLLIIWSDKMKYAKASNNVVTSAPSCSRIIDNCIFNCDCKYIFEIGTLAQVDEPMYENISYEIKNTKLPAVDNVWNVIQATSSQKIKSLIIDRCESDNNVSIIDGTVNNCRMLITEGLYKEIAFDSNFDVVFVTNSIYDRLDYDSSLQNVILTGNVSP